MKRTFLFLILALSLNFTFSQTARTKAEMQNRIDSLINTNGAKKITGAILNNVLKDITESIDGIALEQQVQKKIYKVLISQSGTDAPTAIVLENTLGGVPVWSYDGVGSYVATLINSFPSGKVFFSIGGNPSATYLVYPSVNTINEITLEVTNTSGVYINTALSYFSLLIEVYE